MKKILFILILFISTQVISQNRSIEFRQLTWQETLDAAKNEDKPIFIDCYATWCGPCKWMSANMFTNDAIADFYNENYICVKFDMEKGEGKDLAKKFNIRAYPTLIYADKDEVILLRVVGASQEPQDYVEDGQMAMNPQANLPYYLENKDANMSDQEFMLDYFTIMTKANMVDQKDVDAYFDQFSSEEWTTEQNWTIIRMVAKSSDSKVVQHILENQDMFIDMYGSEATDLITNILYSELANQYYRAKTEEAKTAYYERKKEILNSNYAEVEKVDFLINSFEYSREKKWEEYCSINAKYVDSYYIDNANALNTIAWNFFINTKDKNYLEKALSWSKRSIELNDSHAFLDTYANLLYATGDSQKALETEEKALEMAKQNGEDGKAYQEFIDKIKAEM